nr:uncharacterized protein LOC108181095 [Danio rerio]|eukprot:XP_021325359.1 uncharacterized protein LOC108181095 [Danio rerio]
MILDNQEFLSSAADHVCQFVKGIVGKNPLLLKELNLNDRQLQDTTVKKLSVLLQDKHCKISTLTLNISNITEEDCAALTSAFILNPSNLKELNLSGNKLGNSGISKICPLLENKQCGLEKLRLSDCSISEEGYKALASALKSNPSHLIELDLRGNDPGQSGVKELTELLQDPLCKAKLRFLSSAADDVCQFVKGIVGKNPLLLKKLNLNDRQLQDTTVKKLSVLLQDKHCKISTLTLNISNITEEDCAVLTSAFILNPSNLKELNLSENKLGNSGISKICPLLENKQCGLEKLRFLSSAADHVCQFVKGIVGKNPLLLKELNLNDRQLQDTTVKKLSVLLQDKHCKISTLTLNISNITEEDCAALTSAFILNPSNLKELNLSGNKLGNSGISKICPLLENKQCGLEKLSLSDCSISEEGYKALASALKSNPSHLIELDLRGNDPGQSGVKELTDLSQYRCKTLTIRFLSGSGAEEACAHLTKVVGISPLLLTELDLNEDKLKDLDGEKLSALLMDSHSKVEKMKLNNCELTEKSCPVLAAVLSSKTNLKELNLNNSRLLDSGVRVICEGLKNPVCELKILNLSDCSISEEGYKALASALGSNPSHLIELDLRGNDPGQSGVQELTDVKLNNLTLKFLSPAVDEVCQFVKGIVGKNILLLKDLNLSGHKLDFKKVSQLAAVVLDKHCKLNTIHFLSSSDAVEANEYLTDALGTNPLLLTELDLSKVKLKDHNWEKLSAFLLDSCCIVEKIMLNKCEVTKKMCSVLATVLSKNKLLKEMDLNSSPLLDSGVKKICEGLKKSSLKILNLSDCSISEEGYKALASALRSNPSHLIELDLRGNDPGQSGVKELVEMQQRSSLKTLRFFQGPAEETYQYLIRVFKQNPLISKELNLNETKLDLEKVNQLAVLLQDKHFRINTLQLSKCDLTEESCSVLASVLSSDSSSLKELDLSNNNLQDSGVKQLWNGLKNNNCTLEKLNLSDCSISEEGYKALASALRSNLSHLIELDLRGNDPGQSGVKELTDLLEDRYTKLKTLRFLSPDAEKACKYVPGLVGKDPFLVRELNLRDQKLGDTNIKYLAALLQDKHCKLNTIQLLKCSITEEQCVILTSALKSNPSHLRELDLSENQIKNRAVNLLCDVLKDSHCKLETLSLHDCGITDVSSLAQCLTDTKALQFLKELDLSNNNLEDSEKKLIDAMQDSTCNLKLKSEETAKSTGGWLRWFKS